VARQPVRWGLGLVSLRSVMHWTQDQLGARLGVSRRTLTRWEIHHELPPIGVRKHIVTSLPDAPVELRDRLVRMLGLGDEFLAAAVAAPAGPPQPPPAPQLLDGALLDLCERIDVAPGTVRPAVIEFLRRAEASGFSLETTRTALEGRAPKTAPSS
jgi:DNA-binding XRE family transcriptional regulator